MSDGEACCALEICCGGAERRTKTAQRIAVFAGLDTIQATKMLDWMDSVGIVFAPASFTQVASDIADMVRKHDAEAQAT